MYLHPHLIPYTNINSKWIKNLNVKAKTTKLRKSEGVNLCDLGLSNVFLDMMPKVQAAKEKKQINWTPSKFKTCFSKDSIKKVKTSHRKGENIFKLCICPECI